MGLRGEMQNWFDIVELSKGFRESGQNLGEQGRAAQLRELAARAPEMLAQPGGAERYAAESGALGDPAMLRQLAAQKAGYEQEMGQGLTPEQLGALNIAPEEAAPFANTSVDKQKFLIEQKNQKEKMDFEKSLFFLKKAAKEAEERVKDGGAFKTSEATSSGFFLEMSEASKAMDDAIAKSKGKLVSRLSTDQLLEWMNAPEAIRDEDLKNYAIAMRAYINAKTRKRSGAAITPQEFELEGKPDLPAAGDTPEILAAKRNNRLKVMAGIMTEAGPKAIQTTRKNYEKLKTSAQKDEKKNRYESLKKRIDTIPNPEDRKEAMETLKFYGEDFPDDFITIVNEATVGR